MTISKLPTSASLKQVMDKFEEISFQDFSSIDIITTTELPQQVKEGQIVLLTDIDKGRIVFDVKGLPTNLQENDIYVRYKEGEEGNESFISSSQKTQLNFYINAIALFKNGSLENFEYIYIGRDGVWERILMPIFYIFDGAYKNGFSFTGTSTGGNSPIISDGCLVFTGKSASWGTVTTKKVDLTNFNYLNIIVSSISGRIEIGVSDNTEYMYYNAYQSFASGSHIKVDVSNLMGEYYIKASVLAPMSGSYTTKISSLYFSNK